MRSRKLLGPGLFGLALGRLSMNFWASISVWVIGCSSESDEEDDDDDDEAEESPELDVWRRNKLPSRPPDLIRPRLPLLLLLLPLLLLLFDDELDVGAQLTCERSVGLR